MNVDVFSTESGRSYSTLLPSVYLNTICSDSFRRRVIGYNLLSQQIVQYIAYSDTTDEVAGHGTHVAGMRFGHYPKRCHS